MEIETEKTTLITHKKLYLSRTEKKILELSRYILEEIKVHLDLANKEKEIYKK